MEKELKKYLIEQCREWMLDEELKALRRKSLTAFGKKRTKRIALKEIKMESLYGFNDAKINELAALNVNELELKIAVRLLKDHKSELINNCPKCGSLTRTPKSKQCRYCNHDWH